MCWGIFLCQYVNTAIVLPLSNANFKNTNIKVLSYFDGQYSDFTQQWYLDIGSSLVNTLWIQSFMPWVEFFMLRVKIHVVRYWDGGKWKLHDITKTNTKTVREFVRMHEGPSS